MWEGVSGEGAVGVGVVGVGVVGVGVGGWVGVTEGRGVFLGRMERGVVKGWCH